jgi:putative DNA primase/helicase
LTGRDPIQAARKYLSRLPFVSYAKQIFACNELPFTHDLTDAFFDRWIILNFPFRFLPQKEIQEDPINQNENTKVQDPNIIDKISTDSEMSGLLNWALEGLERLFTNKAFSFSPSTSETRNTWLRKSDSCLAFVMDYIESDYENYIIKSDFKAKYAAYCKLHKVDISDDKQILQVLTTHAGASDDRKSIDIEGSTKQRAVWNGIRFKDCIENLFTTNMGQNSKPSEGRDGISITSNTQGKDTSRNTLSRFTTLSNCDEEKNELNSEKIEEEDF